MALDVMRAQANGGEVKAAGVGVDVRVSKPGESTTTDAIRCGLEHVSGESVDVFLPYNAVWGACDGQIYGMATARPGA